LCSHFGHCQAFAFVEVINGIITDIRLVNPPEHQPGTYPKFVEAQGATDVIGGGMGPQAITLFNEAGINVFIGAPAEDPAKIADDFIQGKLQLSANECDHHGKDHEHHR
jgi:predicted Fe-Mo cluster-binding NifX family protein